MNNKQSTFLEHLSELKSRLIKISLFLFLSTIICFIFHQQILTILMLPASGFEGIPAQKPIYTSLTEFIGIAMKVSLFSGFIVSLPFLIYQIIMFSAPGLTAKEKKYVYFLAPFSLLGFLSGAAFTYFVLLPPSITFLLTFGDDIASPFISIGNYINLVVRLIFWIGLIFETPLVMFFLAKIGLISHKTLSKNRRYAIVFSFVLSAIITPTIDPINQTLVAIPIIVMFELGLILAKIARK